MSAEPCGTCSACSGIDSGRFVDLLEVDAASNTQVDKMRELLFADPKRTLGLVWRQGAALGPALERLAAAIEDAEGFPITAMPISPSDLFELRRTQEKTP